MNKELAIAAGSTALIGVGFVVGRLYTEMRLAHVIAWNNKFNEQVTLRADSLNQTIADLVDPDVDQETFERNMEERLEFIRLTESM